MSESDKATSEKSAFVTLQASADASGRTPAPGNSGPSDKPEVLAAATPCPHGCTTADEHETHQVGSPEWRARIVSNLMEGGCERSRCLDCEKLVADAIREAEAKLRAEIAHLQARLAERRKSFRDAERKWKTCAGARKAIQALGRKLFEARRAEASARAKAFEEAAKLVESAHLRVAVSAQAPFFNPDIPGDVTYHVVTLDQVAEKIRARAKEAPRG